MLEHFGTFGREQKTLYFQFPISLEPPYFLQIPSVWAAEVRTCSVSRLPFPPGARAAEGREKLWASHKKGWFPLSLRATPWIIREKKRSTGKRTHMPSWWAIQCKKGYHVTIWSQASWDWILALSLLYGPRQHPYIPYASVSSSIKWESYSLHYRVTGTLLGTWGAFNEY